MCQYNDGKHFGHRRTGGTHSRLRNLTDWCLRLLGVSELTKEDKVLGVDLVVPLLEYSRNVVGSRPMDRVKYLILGLRVPPI